LLSCLNINLNINNIMLDQPHYYYLLYMYTDTLIIFSNNQVLILHCMNLNDNTAPKFILVLTVNIINNNHSTPKGNLFVTAGYSFESRQNVNGL